MNDNEILYDNLAQHQESSNLPRWQLNLLEELYRFKLALMGLERNEGYGLEVVGEDGKKYVDMREYIPLPGSEMVNRKGATAIHNKLQSELTKIPSDTNFSEAVITTELMAFEVDFPFWLAVNHAEFGLSDKDYNTICETAIRLMKGAMYRSINGWKGSLINNNVQQREVIQSTNNTEIQQNKPRIFGFMGR